ncbi:glutactin-like isoform X2 [Malaya genurostris]|nr:glutactin-like isoform X2 [Malaya genurostris]
MTSRFCQSLPVPDDAPMVTLPNLGTLRGSTTRSAFSGRKILQFLSIKYGESTAGEFRFKAPRKVTGWTGVRDVSQYGLPCPQLKLESMFTNLPAGSDIEDCLSLSVYSTELSGSKPVMFFIHGGGFYEGSGANQTPEYLLEKDIVLVVVQYRLGPLGFLSLKTEEIPGNAGLLDIKLALEWMQENIMFFGGDPGNVTLFGQSAGAAAVSALMYSPLVPDNLFHKVILQSGASSLPWVWDDSPLEHTKELAAIAGCDPNAETPNEIEMSLHHAESCLRKMDIWLLLRSFNDQKNRTFRTLGISKIGGNRLTVDDFHGLLPQKPLTQILHWKAGLSRPMMAGVVKHEGTFILTGVYDALKNGGLLDNSVFIKHGLLERINRILGSNDSTGSLTAYEIRSLFSSQQISSGRFEDMVDGLIDLSGTMTIKAGLLREVQASSQTNPNGTYLYSFDYKGEKTRFGYGANTSHYPFDGGVHHSDDLMYLFPYPPGQPKLNEQDSKMAQMMIDLWTSFASTGTPKSSLAGADWKPMTEFTGPYLHIDEKPTIGYNFYDEFSVVSDEKRKTRKSS